mmetsp:Transcript_3529/g.7322  ORF Transcript_3529/g.7322 Transcript_3529/m.7322 type:complete len:461 (+) Transcript_3529:47-1429(+)
MASPLLKTTSKAASTAAIAPSSDAITSSSAASSSAAASAPTKPAADAAEGCRACGKDDDHANLLLCEACNDEYHTYCLNPPLSSVPEGDFFCVKCKHIHSSKNDDGLDSLVSALPPSFTSRFGEIVWAAGGVGFGWWPACIYDPRLTVGGARQLARKNLGRKHLVYFFECNDAPFTVLSDHRLTKWDEGFLEEYDLGKIAKSSKSRSASFEKALHVAMLENGRPMELRMDWNHQGTLTANQPKLSKGKQNTINSPINENQNPNKKHKPSPPTSPEMNVDAVKVASCSSLHKIGHILVGHNAQSTSLNRTNMISAVTSLASRDKANPIEPLENGTLVCKILRKKKLLPTQASPPFGIADTLRTDGMDFSENIGFVTLSSRRSATYQHIRKAIETDLDDGCFEMVDGKRRGWKFYVPKLGPVSIKQEVKIGPVLEFLRSTTNNSLLGNGSASNPLKIVIMDR